MTKPHPCMKANKFQNQTMQPLVEVRLSTNIHSAEMKQGEKPSRRTAGGVVVSTQKLNKQASNKHSEHCCPPSPYKVRVNPNFIRSDSPRRTGLPCSCSRIVSILGGTNPTRYTGCKHPMADALIPRGYKATDFHQTFEAG